MAKQGNTNGRKPPRPIRTNNQGYMVSKSRRDPNGGCVVLALFLLGTPIAGVAWALKEVLS